MGPLEKGPLLCSLKTHSLNLFIDGDFMEKMFRLLTQQPLKEISWLAKASLLTYALWSQAAHATVSGSDVFCQKYPQTLGCNNPATACASCHAGPPSLNPFGLDIKKHLTGTLDAGLLVAIQEIEMLDSDGDGISNKIELTSGGSPGNPAIKPPEELKLTYNPEVAMRRIKAVYCGTGVRYEELMAVKKAADPKAILHETLTGCLDSAFWKNEALHRLADKKIQPLAAVGFGGSVVIGDYRFDYRLFSYVMTGDRDVRELLSAQYHIDAAGNRIEGVVRREEPFELGERIVIAGGQPLQPARRAGMITTQWFLSFYTMFSQLPRNSAAQAYRAYLGLDLAKGEGLHPVAGEPRDVDNRRVAQPACAACHSTLDPLAYAFSTYKGIEVSAALAFGNPIGTYDAARAPWEAQGQIMGESVTDLLEWAEVARNSPAFMQNIAHMMFHQALSRNPLAHEQKEFEALWKGLPQDGYSVNKMLHRMIETMAFGGTP
jgi:cytochrome c553